MPYPTYDLTGQTFSDLIKDWDVEQDLILFYENGEVLKASDGDIVANSFSFTDYYTTDEDYTFGDVTAPTCSIEVRTDTFDAKNPTGLCRVYIGARKDYTATPTPYGVSDFPMLRYEDEDYSRDVYLPQNKTVVLETGGSPVYYLNPITGTTGTQASIAADVTRIIGDESRLTVYYHTGSNPDTNYYSTEFGYNGSTYVSYNVGTAATKAAATLPSTSLTTNVNGTLIYSQVCMPNMLICPLGVFDFVPDDIMSGNTIRINGQVPPALDSDASDFIAMYSDGFTYPVSAEYYLDYLGYNGGNGVNIWRGFTAPQRFPYIGDTRFYPNAVNILSRPTFENNVTFRDIAKDVAALTCSNIVYGRDGILCFPNITDSIGIADTIGQTRIEASSYAISRRTAQSIDDLLYYDADGTAHTVGGGSGVLYELPYNPLLNGQALSYYSTYLAVCNESGYHPQNLHVIAADPSVLSGDTIQVDYGGSLGTFKFRVMAQTITFPGRCVAEYSCTASVNRNEKTSADFSAKDAQQTADEALSLAQSVGSSKVPFMGEESSDLDNCDTPGFYDYLSSSAHTPTASAGGALIVFAGPSPYMMQYAIPRNPAGVSTAYVRQYTSGGVWGPWAELLTTAPAPTWTDITSTALSAADTSKATIANLKLYACGNMRLLQGYITAVNLPTTQTTVANITTGNRPSDQVAVSCAWDSARYVTWGVVGTGGAIAIRSSSAYTSGNLRMNAMWLV